MNHFSTYWVTPSLWLTILFGCFTPSVFLTWLSLELSVLLFLVAMKASKYLKSSENLIYYFVIQALGSSVILFCWVTLSASSLTTSLLMLSFIMKLGIFPCHNWYLNLINMISWDNFWLLSVPLKLVVLKLMFMMMINELILALGVVNILVSFILVFKEKKVINFLGLASIFNVGWAMLGFSDSLVWLLFMAIYGLNLKLILHAFSYSAFEKTSSSLMHQSELFRQQILMAGLLIMGLPPFPGFLLKLLIFLILLDGVVSIAILVLMTSLIMTFYYFMLFFRSSTSVHSKPASIFMTAPHSLLLLVGANTIVSVCLLSGLIYYLNNKLLQ